MIRLDKLKIYQLSREIGREIHEILRVFPPEEKYVRTPQIKRSLISISANIAEGAGRGTKKDGHRFLYISRGSLNETKYYIELAKDLQYISAKTFSDLNSKFDKLGRMITSFIKNSRNNTQLH